MVTAALTISRQAVFPERGVIELTTIEVQPPASDQLLMRVRRVGICATDLHLLEGHIGDPFPLVPGPRVRGRGRRDRRRRSAATAASRSATASPWRCSCPAVRARAARRADTTSAIVMIRPAGLPVGREYGINIPRTARTGPLGRLRRLPARARRRDRAPASRDHALGHRRARRAARRVVPGGAARPGHRRRHGRHHRPRPGGPSDLGRREDRRGGTCRHGRHPPEPTRPRSPLRHRRHGELPRGRRRRGRCRGGARRAGGCRHRDRRGHRCAVARGDARAPWRPRRARRRVRVECRRHVRRRPRLAHARDRRAALVPLSGRL